MLRNAANLRILGTGFSAAFARGLGQADSMYERVATVVPSTTGQNEYGWLGKIPRVREWLGDRVVNQLKGHTYTIKNRKFENTIEVEADDIDDDNVGIYGPLFEEMGQSAPAHYNEIVYGLLADGFSAKCYDGQFFFDTDHPVLDEDGETMISVANTDGGAGAPWILVDDKRALKPIILQMRKRMGQLVAKDAPTDDNVFDRDVYKYGIDGRHNVGFGFWQFAWGSKQTLDPAHYETARASLMGMKGDHGRKLGVIPRTLFVGPTNEGAGRALLNNDQDANGATNKWKGTAELVVVPWLP